MPTTIATPRRLHNPAIRPVTRATKRPRLSNPSLTPSRTNKRKHDERPHPSVRKRRSSTAPTPPPAKRVRKLNDLEQRDIEMTDLIPKRRTRKKTLKDVLRSHRIKQTVLEIPVTPFVQPNASQATNTSQPTTFQDQGDARTQCSQVDQSPPPVYLTGDEQVDVIDISEATNIEDQAEINDANPLQAHLLEDGRCFVRISRPDGAIDYYTLHPYEQTE